MTAAGCSWGDAAVHEGLDGLEEHTRETQAALDPSERVQCISGQPLSTGGGNTSWSPSTARSYSHNLPGVQTVQPAYRIAVVAAAIDEM